MGANWLLKEWWNFKPRIPYRNIDNACAGDFGKAPCEEVACIVEGDDLWTKSRARARLTPPCKILAFPPTPRHPACDPPAAPPRIRASAPSLPHAHARAAPGLWV